MQGLFKSALLSYLSGAPIRIGFRNLQEGAYPLCNRIVSCRIAGTCTRWKATSASPPPWKPPSSRWSSGSRSPRRIGSYAASLGERPVSPRRAHPGRPLADTKQWPPERFAAVAEALHREFGSTALVIGARRRCTRLAARLQAATSAPVLDLTGRTTLKQAAALFPRCAHHRLHRHRPHAPLRGHGHAHRRGLRPDQSAPLRPLWRGHAVVWAHVSCAPCRKRECRSPRCLEVVTPEQVLAAARPRLAARLQEVAHGR